MTDTKPSSTKAPIPEKTEPAKPTKIVAFSLSLDGDFAVVENDEDQLKKLEEDCKAELRRVHGQQAGFKDVLILGFSDGSIVVRYMAIFEGDNAPSNQEIEQETERMILNGNFSIGNYSIHNDSFVPIEPTAEEIANAQQDGLCSPSCGEGVCNVTTAYGVLVAQCVCKENYCYNSGTCDFDGGPKCRCDDDPTGFYTGDRCDFYASQPLVIGVGAGVVGLLLIIIIALSICLCCRRNKKGADFERPLTPENGYWSPDEKVPMTKDTQDMNDEMPLYSMVNKRQTYSDDSSGSEKNNLARASRLSSQDNGNSTNNSFLHGNLQTFGGHDNRAFDWRPTVENVPVDQKFKLPRARVSTSNNEW